MFRKQDRRIASFHLYFLVSTFVHRYDDRNSAARYLLKRFCVCSGRCKIGAGAVVAEGSVVDEGGQIAAGTVVPPGCLVPKNELWAGNPAK